MNKLLKPQEAIKISKDLRHQGKRIVLAGGCFDILHTGHIAYLTKAKEQGDILMVLLENDETIRKIKGKNRPFHAQKDRAAILASLEVVDYIVLLPFMENDANYDKLVISLKPDIIAATKGDPQEANKQRQARSVNAKVVEVIKRISESSTSKLAKLLYQKV